jgi:hypothetical protein
VYETILFDSLGWEDREWSRKLGIACNQLLFQTAAAQLEAGTSVALESNFSVQWDTPKMLELLARVSVLVFR